jgi:hypothetical protein
MKKFILSIIFISVFFPGFSETIQSERLYGLRILSFSRIYEIYCTKKPVGYYKYEIEENKNIVYLTYEGLDFYKQCLFDENYKVISDFLPLNIWTNTRGELMRFKKKFGPVIEKDRPRKDSGYGYDEN